MTHKDEIIAGMELHIEKLREVNAELTQETEKLKARVKKLEDYIRGLRIVGS